MTRLATGLLVNALVRRVHDDGGSAAVLARGDADAGAMLIVATVRGAGARCWERGRDARGRRALVPAGPQDDDGKVADYWQRRRASDRDLWVIELDSADAERFAAETILDD